MKNCFCGRIHLEADSDMDNDIEAAQKLFKRVTIMYIVQCTFRLKSSS